MDDKPARRGLVDITRRASGRIGAAAAWVAGAVIDLAVEDACVLCRGGSESAALEGPAIDLVDPVRHRTFFGRFEIVNHPVCRGCADRLPAARSAGQLGRWMGRGAVVTQRGDVFGEGRGTDAEGGPGNASRGRHAAAADSVESSGEIPVIAPFMVDDNVLKLIHLLKFGGYEALSGPMARSMARVARTWGLGPGPGDLLVPVPMDAKRLKRRGFNQSEQLARGLAVELGLPVQARSLAKTGSARPQSRTPSERRAANVRNAFTCPPEARGDIAGRRVILVDDLVTTGATAGACLSALLDAGAGSAAVVSFGRAL